MTCTRASFNILSGQIKQSRPQRLFFSLFSDCHSRLVSDPQHLLLVQLEDVLSPLLLHIQITYSVPFSVTAELTAGTGGGQGLCRRCLLLCSMFQLLILTENACPCSGLATGVLNLAIVAPQVGLYT